MLWNQSLSIEFAIPRNSVTTACAGMPRVINLAGITRILELEEENRELRRQVERLRKPAGSSVFAADADGGIVEVERSQRARMWRRQLRADARQLPSRESVRAERAEEGDDMGSRSVVVWGIR